MKKMPLVLATQELSEACEKWNAAEAARKRAETLWEDAATVYDEAVIGPDYTETQQAAALVALTKMDEARIRLRAELCEIHGIRDRAYNAWKAACETEAASPDV